MINYKNIIQGTDEWHAIKWGKIGGTLSKGLLVNSDTLFLDLLSQQAEEFELSDGFSTPDTERGTELEPLARAALEDKVGVRFNETGWLESTENTLLGLSPDGISEDETEACEIKCFARKKHTSIIYKQMIPNENAPQLIHYFTVNEKLKKLHFFCYRPESLKHFYALITLDTLIDIGTEAKPVVKTVAEWVEISKNSASLLKIKLDEAITSLSF
jgi:hypothetical protein